MISLLSARWAVGRCCLSWLSRVNWSRSAQRGAVGRRLVVGGVVKRHVESAEWRGSLTHVIYNRSRGTLSASAFTLNPEQSSRDFCAFLLLTGGVCFSELRLELLFLFWICVAFIFFVCHGFLCWFSFKYWFWFWLGFSFSSSGFTSFLY